MSLLEREELRRRVQEWERNLLGPALEREPERDPSFFELDAGPGVKTVYTPLDLEERGLDWSRDLGMPGEFPFTRGTTPSGSRSRPPLVKIYSGLGSPEETNVRYRNLLNWGAEFIHMATDLPSQVGYDSDHIMASGEVGRAGVAVASLRDMEVIFDGLPLNRFRRIGMLGNCIGPVALALFIALGEKQGLATSDYVVDVQNDPLKEYVARGTQFLPVRPAVRLATDVVAWCARHAPHWRPMDICVNHLNAAGAGSSYGTAFALANAIQYIDTLLDQGLEIDQVAPLLTMFLDERDDFFAAVANIRATRRIWARMMKERYGAQDPRSMALEVTAYGHGRETRREPLNNIARIAMGTLAYFLAGVQTLYDASYDEVLGIPSEEAVKVAVRTQQILAWEQGFGHTVDPLGGSYYVEALTHELEQRILRALAGVEERGGAVSCIENGYIKGIITEGAVRRQRRFEAGLRVMVGVNKFAVPADTGAPTVQVTRINANVDEIQLRRLAEVRAERDNPRVRAALARVADAARGGDNLVPPVLEAVRAYATIGEICAQFRAVFGEWQPDQDY